MSGDFLWVPHLSHGRVAQWSRRWRRADGIAAPLAPAFSHPCSWRFIVWTKVWSDHSGGRGPGTSVRFKRWPSRPPWKGSILAKLNRGKGGIVTDFREQELAFCSLFFSIYSFLFLVGIRVSIIWEDSRIYFCHLNTMILHKDLFFSNYHSIELVICDQVIFMKILRIICWEISKFS